MTRAASIRSSTCDVTNVARAASAAASGESVRVDANVGRAQRRARHRRDRLEPEQHGAGDEPDAGDDEHREEHEDDDADELSEQKKLDRKINKYYL